MINKYKRESKMKLYRHILQNKNNYYVQIDNERGTIHKNMGVQFRNHNNREADIHFTNSDLKEGKEPLAF